MPGPLFYGTDLAYIHHVGFGGFVAAAAPALVERLTAVRIRDGVVVDLGCGSGLLARELVRCGYDVVGIDQSPEMLALARRAAPRARFMRARIADARLPRCRAVFAIGETLSYLDRGSQRPRVLRPLFARLARVLQPGGLFIFDLVVQKAGSAMAYRTWQAGEDWAVLVDVREDAAARTVTRHITTFRDAAGGYRRTDERHVVGVYSRADVLAWLRAAGFSATVSRQYGSVRLPPRRLAFFARRRQSTIIE